MGRTISLAAALLIIFCFFLPWATVSCAGRSVATVSGQDLAGGITVSALGNTERIEGEPILYVIPLAGFLSLILALVSGRAGKAGAVLQILAGLAGGLLLFLTWSNMQSQAQQYNFTVSLQYGYLGTVLAVLGILVGAVFKMGETPSRYGNDSSFDNIDSSWDDW